MNLITFQPDMSIEPGHQWIVLPADPTGYALADLLLNGSLSRMRTNGTSLMIAHDHEVDARIVALIDELAHMRFLAPNLIQLTMEEAQP